MTEEYVLIAKIRKPHGLKGEISLESFTWDNSRFKKLTRVFLRDLNGKILEVQLKDIRVSTQSILVKVVGYEDRTAVEALRNMDVLIPLSERLPLPGQRAYFDEIIGLKVVDDASGAQLGVVRDVQEYPAGDVFVMDFGGVEHLVTGAGEEIRKIDVAKGEVRVTLLEEWSAPRKP